MDHHIDDTVQHVGIRNLFSLLDKMIAELLEFLQGELVEDADGRSGFAGLAKDCEKRAHPLISLNRRSGPSVSLGLCHTGLLSG